MPVSRSFLTTFLAGALLSLLGCGSDVCKSSSECATVCVVDGYILPYSAVDEGLPPGQCASSCRTTDDCSTEEACVAVGSDSVCLPRCTTHDETSPDFFCRAGVPTACSEANVGEVPCGRCCDTFDCPVCAGDEFCNIYEVAAQCEPLGEVGDACAFNHECASDNCGGGGISATQGTCLVAHGAPCNGSNCSRCVSTGGTTFCHQECRGDLACPGDAQNCYGYPAEDRYWCHEDATSSGTCPGGYTDVFYTDLGQSHVACIPTVNSYVCGSASVGAPCD